MYGPFVRGILLYYGLGFLCYSPTQKFQELERLYIESIRHCHSLRQLRAWGRQYHEQEGHQGRPWGSLTLRPPGRLLIPRDGDVRKLVNTLHYLVWKFLIVYHNNRSRDDQDTATYQLIHGCLNTEAHQHQPIPLYFLRHLPTTCLTDRHDAHILYHRR